MENRPTAIQVEIFGQTYSVRAAGEAEYILDLAAFVDRKMREVIRGGSSPWRAASSRSWTRSWESCLRRSRRGPEQNDVAPCAVRD